MIRSTSPTHEELEAIRDRVRFVGRMSDSLIHIGPFSLGLDGLASWIPGLGEVYSIAAGGFILWQGWRAGVPAHVLGGAFAILGVRTLATAVPILGSAFADVFTAHKWAAAMVARSIDDRLGVSSPADAGALRRNLLRFDARA